MNITITLTPTERLILSTLLEDAPANRFEHWTQDDGTPVTEEYLSDLWDKLSALYTYYTEDES